VSQGFAQILVDRLASDRRAAAAAVPWLERWTSPGVTDEPPLAAHLPADGNDDGVAHAHDQIGGRPE
jgi:hypothetical protein